MPTQHWTMGDNTTMHHVVINGNRPGEFFFDQDGSLKKALEGNLFADSTYRPLALTAAPDVLQTSRLLDFPNEILISILLDIDDEVDRYCFGLSCVHLFTLCEEYWLRTYKIGSTKPRFLCVGDFSEWEGFLRPSFELLAIFTSDSKTAEQYLAEIKSTPDETLHPMSVASEGPTTFALRRLAAKAWKRLLPADCQTIDIKESVQSCDELLRTSIKGAHREFTALGIEVTGAETILRSLMREPSSTFKASIKPGTKTVLRNHTKKLFVLEDPLIEVLEDTFDATSHYGIFTTLVQVALGQVCFPGDDGLILRVSRTVSWELIKGAWVGDEMDIVAESEFYSDFRSGSIDPKGWKNDTARILELLWAINTGDLQPRKGVDREERKAYLDSVLVPGKTLNELLAERA